MYRPQWMWPRPTIEQKDKILGQGTQKRRFEEIFRYNVAKGSSKSRKMEQLGVFP